jgi:hypothetical protein
VDDAEDVEYGGRAEAVEVCRGSADSAAVEEGVTVVASKEEN